jgi:hypothetical protein
LSSRTAEAESAVRYLLGRMTEEESRELEQKVLQNREFFDDVMATEDELIDEYLDGALTPEERQQFERAYLSAPDRRARVDFARALRDKLAREPKAVFPARVETRSPQPARRAASTWAWAAAAAIFAALFAYFAYDASRLRGELGRLREAKASAERHDAEISSQIADLRGRGDRLEKDLQTQRDEAARLADQLAEAKAQGSRVIPFLLTATLVRGGGALPTLSVPADAASVRFTVPVTPGSSYTSWRAVVQSPEGSNHWAGTGAWPAATAKAIVVTMPASALPAGDYILSLTGVMASGQREPAADFSFRVKRG